MIGYIARGPVGSLFEHVKVRIFAQRPVSLTAPDGHLSVVVQAVGPRGIIIAESPLCKEVMAPEALEAALAISRREGWRIEIDEKTAKMQGVIDRRRAGDRGSRPPSRNSGKLAPFHKLGKPVDLKG